jgi:hypothetical protein
MQPPHLPDPTTSAPTGANPGYVAGQLARALTARESHPDADVRARSARKVEVWARVFQGMLAGSLQIGSRVPVTGAPAWATLEVAHGGFATGGLLAGGPLQPHEHELLARLPAVAPGTERAALNAYFLSEDGLAGLRRMLATGCYRVAVPEEGALLVVAWLVERGHADAARALLEEIGPHFPRLRFYPVPDDRPLTAGAVAHLQDVGTTVAHLEAVRPNLLVERQKEAVRVWQPLYDRVAALFAETVEGPLPTLHAETDGKYRVEGGWPCQHYPDGWADRARAVLDDYRRLRAQHQLCKGPDSRRDGFAVLRGYLERCARDTKALTGRDVGKIRAILAGIVTRRGAPGSGRAEALGAFHARQVAAPGRHELTRVLVGRLARLPDEEGVPSLDEALAPVSADEEKSFDVPAGSVIPPGLARKVRRALDAPLGVLVAEGIIPSAETLARVVPQITAQVRAAGVTDPELRRLYAAVYAAFRRRRSLLLLNLQSQVKLEELPWVRAINAFRVDGADTRRQARLVLEELVTAAVTGFPQQILPNKLLQEVRALVEGAGLDVPVVDEVAADIFMGTFSEKFVRAAQIAAGVLEGTLYGRYYGVPFARVRAIDDVKQSRYGTSTSATFIALCNELAGSGGSGNWVARNGTVIEQEQILTTHNLAPLFESLRLTATLRPQLEGLALRCFDWICRRLRQTKGHWKSRLQAVKNAAYAWRQMVFFLTVAPEGTVESFLAKARERLSQQPETFQMRLAPALAGLARAARGLPVEAAASPEEPHGARRFLGWTTGKHWLLG